MRYRRKRADFIEPHQESSSLCWAKGCVRVPLWTAWCLVVAFGLAATLRASSTPSAPSDRRLTSEYIVDTWTTRHGLPQNMIRALLQTRDGYLWIGTANAGLVRFDGLGFAVFDVTNTAALPSNGITALHEDAGGLLWIGTHSGLATYRDGDFAAVDDEVTRHLITAITSDSSGRTWIATPTQVARRDHLIGPAQAGPHDGSGSRDWTVVFDRPDAAHINDLLVDEAGAAWIASDGGFFVATEEGTSTVPPLAALPRRPSRHRIFNMRTIAITIEDDVLERVDRLLRRTDSGTANRSRFIRRAVRDYIDRLEQQADEEHETAVVRRHRARLARQARALIDGQAEP